MKRLDQATVQKVLDTADIVDVVSDFVKLRRRGSGYIGLCPFHNERTPSFSVSKTKNICKCFSCGQGGSPVNFIMLHEKMTFQEAIRYLANKYHIEIAERELSAQEQAEMSERESLMGINEFALNAFVSAMNDTPEGRNVGLAYFRERGINDEMIKRFSLGWSPDARDAISTLATERGYDPELLVKTGLSYRTDRGELRDRFRARVIYPVFTVSGKVVAFGGRTLRSDKTVAKYVNSPESSIYSKSRELYGLFQAKGAIVRKGKCILVEGYMDVISMHQAGVENVVASSGTSLTEGQIRLIHRFTEDVTVIYDSDAAGIKASLRSIDLLLAEGLNIKVLQLPDGDDPDSFAQSHSSTEVEEYLAANEVDFIRFKTKILLADADDPVRRSAVITDIVRSISVIPDQIKRTVYIDECSRLLGISDKVLLSTMVSMRTDAAKRNADERQRQQARESLNTPAAPPAADPATPTAPRTDADAERYLRGPETDLVHYIVRFGLVPFCDLPAEEGDDPDAPPRSMTVAEYVDYELQTDGLTLTTPGLADILTRTLEMQRTQWPADYQAETERAAARRADAWAKGIEEIRDTAQDIAAIEAAEQALTERIDTAYLNELDNYACRYAGRHLVNDLDDRVRAIATELITERHTLSKIHSRFAHIETERDRLSRLLPQAVFVLKNAWIELELYRLNRAIRALGAQPDPGQLTKMLTRLTELNALKKEFARQIGDRILPQSR